ncbi:MAG TPA: tetratricopeptide repeat protein [Armatimonadota bacterium]|jgi:tetratricopeptide (TPR) repeat protein
MTTSEKRFFHLSFTSPAFSRLEEAESFFLQGNLNEALAAAQQAWREFPQESDVFRVLAYIHMARGEYPPAAQAAYQSVVLDAENPASYATLAQVYITFNMISNALQTLNTAGQRFPEDTALMTLAADAHFRSGQENDAVRLAGYVLQKNPEDAYAKALLGMYRLRKRAYAAAANLFAVAVEAYPQRWDYLRDYGIALLQTNRAAAARDMLLRSFRLNPEDLSTQRHLLYADRLLDPRLAWTWRISFFVFNHPTFGWLALIAGALATLIGGIMGIGTLIDLQNTTSRDLLTVLLTLFGGVALLVLSYPGVAMCGRKGKRLVLQVWKIADSLEAQPVS